MSTGWSSYDTAAKSHDRVAVRTLFEQPAHDLIAKLDLRSARCILDIGTGTGVAALHAIDITHGEALVAGIDPSIEMLRIAGTNGLRLRAAALIPGLPFASAAFDRILASFVLSHVPSYSAALLDVARVLKPGGRFGCTSWGSIENEFRAAWQSIAESFVDKDMLARAVKEALPWEEWFTDTDRLADALRASELKDVEVHRLVYKIQTNISDFLAMREGSIQARFMRHHLGANEWKNFKKSATDEFYRRFADPIEHTRDVLIAIGTRP